MELDYVNREDIGGRNIWKTIDDYKNYILFTNVWNEEDKIEETFEMVFNFTVRPKLWVWIDDGSTDNTGYLIEKYIQTYGVTMPTVVLHMPKKDKGDLSTIGLAYNVAFEAFNLRDLRFDFEFMAIMDVDNIIKPDYFEKVGHGFFFEPHFGVISGRHEEEKLKVPMGGSKCIRWWIVRSIDKFWDPAPDMQLNIEARARNMAWAIINKPVGMIGGPISARNRTKDGSYYAGSLWRYVGGSYIGMFERVIYRIFRRRHGIAFFKGFWENKKWKCDNKHVIEYYKGHLSYFSDWCKRTWIHIIGWPSKGVRAFSNWFRL